MYLLDITDHTNNFTQTVVLLTFILIHPTDKNTFHNEQEKTLLLHLLDNSGLFKLGVEFNLNLTAAGLG